LLFLACGGFYGGLVWTSDRDLKEAMAEADRLDPDGWRPEEIDARRKELPDEENAALVVLAVKTKLRQPWPPPRLGVAAVALPPGQTVDVLTDLYVLPPEVQIDDALLADLRASLEAAGPALDEARKLPTLHDGRFPFQRAPDGISTLINSHEARTAAHLLRLEAALLSQEGKADAALAATRGMVVAARSVGDEPTTISQLIRVACAAGAVQMLERVLAQGEPSPAALKQMQELLEAEAAEPVLLMAARGERAAMHQLMTAIKAGAVKPSALVGGSGGGDVVLDSAAPVLARGSHPRMLRLLNEYVEAAKLPPERQGEAMEAVERKIKQAKVEYDIMTGLFMPAVLKIGEASRRDQAYLRCAIVGVAAERYRQERHDWPAKVDDLVPHFLKAVPADPYDGQPLRYKRLADGVVVYSVGPDGQDNGGGRGVNALTKQSDYPFRLWDVARRRRPAAEVLPPPIEALGP
jgi:hypothetical protein